MSKISRRNFIKGAGVAALAVAAAGALSGCATTYEQDVEVNFYANGQKLELTGKGKVQSDSDEMNTTTIEMPADYEAAYEITGEKVQVIREDGKCYANVNLTVKEVTYQVYYKLSDSTVLKGEVKAAAVNPTITVDDLYQSEKDQLAKMFYETVGGVQLSNNTVIVPVQKIMGEVSVEYWQKSTLFPENPSYDSKVDNGGYNKKISVWKGQNTISKNELPNFTQACSMGYDSNKTDNTFEIDWTNPVVKVYLSY